MKRRKLLTGISTAAVALALCMGITGTAQAAKANDASVVQTEVTQLGAPAAPVISLGRTVRSGENVTGWEVAIPKVPEGYTLHLNVYPAGKPKESKTGYWREDKNGVEYFYSNDDYQFDEYYSNGVKIISSSGLEPGAYTMEAYLYMDRVGDPTSWVPAHYDEEDEEWYEGYYARYIGGADYGAEYRSAASNQLSVTAVLGVPSVSTAIKSNSIQLSMGRSSRYVTGYEIYRKTGKKFNKIAKTTKAVYTDTGLTADTKYQYKVRSYYYNKDTKAVSYSPYRTLERTTSGSALKLKAQVTGNKNVKLTWTKVPGAIRYEVYRTKDYSDYTEYEKGGKYNNSFSSKDLLKTLKKNKKTYTDKKTSVNQGYGYTVVAVLKGGKQQVTDYVSVNIAFETPRCLEYNTASGGKVVEWKKVYGASGYLVEKYDPADGTYKPFKNLGKNTTKVTLPAVTPYWYQRTGSTSYNCCTEEEYHIRAVKGSSVSDAAEVSVYSTLGVVSNVTAKKVSNGIQVSWSSVPGASYYQVYRVKAGELVRDKDTKTYDLVSEYDYGSEQQVTEYYGVVTPQVSPAQPGDTEVRYYQNYSYSMDRTTQTTMLDYAGMIVEWDGQKASDVDTVGPQEGVAYQYYVVAYQADVLDMRTLSVHNTTTHMDDPNIEVPRYGIKCPYPDANGNYDTSYGAYRTTIGCAKIGEATYTAAAAPAKVKIKSVKAGSKSATITFKKVAGATNYKIYRSTKKKGQYFCVGTTKKTKYKDTKLTSKKTYYYKVVAVKENEVGADVDSAASKPKSVKVK